MMKTGELWFSGDSVRTGFVMKFRNGYKVQIEFLKDEENVEHINTIAEKRELIENISWPTILKFIDDLQIEEGVEVGISFDVCIFNPKNRAFRLPSWSKHIDSKSGVSLEEVVDILYQVKNL